MSYVKSVYMPDLLPENEWRLKIEKAALKNGTKIISRGECNGKIANQIKRLGGLTYSPVFIPDGYEVPMSELSAEEYEKAHNHRDKAFSQLLKQI